MLSVPQRIRQRKALLERLGLKEEIVSIDSKFMGHVKNWWAAADIACSHAIVSKQSPTHALIIEDDAIVADDFIKTVELLINLYPSRVLSFFTRSKAVLGLAEGTIVRVTDDVPTDLAVVYPVPYLKELRAKYLEHEQDFERSKRRWGYGADEMRLELEPDKIVWATVPSIVEHGGAISSTLGHYYPSNIARRYIGNNISALSIDWKANS
jgi:hypothetical protein